jgi:hypothetical protein
MSAPRALLVVPPVYDFALFDLFLKPYGLLRVGRWLEEGGYEVRVVDGLDYTDPASAALLGGARRGLDGTGKFFKTSAETPPGLQGLPSGTQDTASSPRSSAPVSLPGTLILYSSPLG